jgi:hypothetical protein
VSLRRPLRALRPDLHRFLFADIGDPTDGASLSVVSAFARLGLDPWQEAERLSSLAPPEATEQLARLLSELPDLPRPLQEARGIARPLIDLLPKRDGAPLSLQMQLRLHPRSLSQKLPSLPWMICGLLVAAVLISSLLHGALPFGIWQFGS